MPITSTLRRTTTVTDPAEFDRRLTSLLERLLPYLKKQAGFVSHDLRREGDRGEMVETTTWQSEADCRNFLRNGAAAMAATWLDAFFPTAPYPNGTWVRTTADRT